MLYPLYMYTLVLETCQERTKLIHAINTGRVVTGAQRMNNAQELLTSGYLADSVILSLGNWALDKDASLLVMPPPLSSHNLCSTL